MRLSLIAAILISTLPATGVAQQSGAGTPTAQSYTTQAPRSAQPIPDDPDQRVCLRDPDTRKLICHTRAEWRWIAINRNRPSLDAK
jgi:hypothetical protein